MEFLLYSFLVFSCVCIFVWAYKLIWGKPFRFHHFVQRVFITDCLYDPEFLTFLGPLENTIWDFHSSRLTTLSLEADAKHIKRLKKNLKILQSYNHEKLSKKIRRF